MYLILDSSSILSGRLNSIPGSFEGVYMTSLVKEEIEKGDPKRTLDSLLEMGLEVRDPVSVEDAKRAAEGTGDLTSLSKADISIIALALEVKPCRVSTDDFRVQNVLLSLGIPYDPAGEIGQRTIGEKWSWTWRCKGCGRYFQEENQDCPICGSPIRKVRRE